MDTKRTSHVNTNHSINVQNMIANESIRKNRQHTQVAGILTDGRKLHDDMEVLVGGGDEECSDNLLKRFNSRIDTAYSSGLRICLTFMLSSAEGISGDSFPGYQISSLTHARRTHHPEIESELASLPENVCSFSFRVTFSKLSTVSLFLILTKKGLLDLLRNLSSKPMIEQFTGLSL